MDQFNYPLLLNTISQKDIIKINNLIFKQDNLFIYIDKQIDNPQLGDNIQFRQLSKKQNSEKEKEKPDKFTFNTINHKILDVDFQGEICILKILYPKSMLKDLKVKDINLIKKNLDIYLINSSLQHDILFKIEYLHSS